MVTCKDGEFHLFYLYDRLHHAAKWGLGAHQYGHFSSTDLKHWTHHPLAVSIELQWECAMGTGNVIYNEDDRKWYAFYTDCGSRIEFVDKPQHGAWLFRSVSEDGIHFTKDFKPVLPGFDTTSFVVPAAEALGRDCAGPVECPSTCFLTRHRSGYTPWAQQHENDPRHPVRHPCSRRRQPRRRDPGLHQRPRCPSRPYGGEVNPLTRSEAVGCRPVEEAGAVRLHLTLPESLSKAATKRVTTELLGKARMTGVRYENPNGPPLMIDTDYFGKTRSTATPTAGPFEHPVQGALVLRVW